MSINLLPAEEKNKSGKIKYQSTPIVQMTGPVKMEKTKPAIKRGGVLGFFKQVFIKPKPLTPDEEKRLPEKKIVVEERIVFEKPRLQAAPRPIVRMMAPQAEGMQVRHKTPLGERMGNFFRSIFGSKPKVPAAAPVVPPAHAENTFPKYQPVRAEKIKAEEPAWKPKPIEVITVTTNGKQPGLARTPMATPSEGRRVNILHEGFPKVDPAFKVIKQTSVPGSQSTAAHASVWQKISKWFKRLFSRAPKQKIVPMAQPGMPSAPHKPEPQVIVRTEQKIPPLQKPSDVPPPPVSKPEPVVRPIMPPFTRPDVASYHQVQPKPAQEKTFIPPAPLKPANIPPPPKPVGMPVPPPSLPIAPTPDGKKEDSLPWWKKMWASILGLFRGKQLSNKKISLKPIGSVQNIPGVKLTEVKGSGTAVSPIEWEVNLVPEEAVEKALPISKIFVGILCVIISVGIVFGGWIAANYYYSNVTAKVSGLNGQIASNRIEINSYQDVQKNVRELNQAMSNINTLVKQHIYWSGIFNKLENYTVSGVYYTSLTADVNGAVALNAIGQDYESAIKQLEVFRRASDFVSKVTVNGICFATDKACLDTGNENLLIVPTTETVKFSVNLMILPAIFYWPK